MYCETELRDISTTAQTADEVALPADAAERKRVLNILAQRRYRRRRKERQLALEDLVSRSVERSCTTAQLSPRASSSGSPNSDSTTSTTESSIDAFPPLSDSSWISSKDLSWAMDPWDLNIDLSASLTHTSWTIPEEVTDLNSFLQTDDIRNATFADDFHIAVPELDLLRAAYEVAGRLQSSQMLFAGLNAQSIFHSADCSSWICTLPDNLKPTDAQLMIPHHPIIDIFPWPAVRTRLIKMYNLPSDLWPRHPSDGTESSVVRMVYDMEDGGVRVTGPDPSKETAWEVEQKFFDTWWWALDQSVVNGSNQRRLARGQPLLCSRPSDG